MSNSVFTDDELLSFTVEQLKNVCSYLNITTGSKFKKSDYITAIKNNPGLRNIEYHPQYFLEDTEPKYSVRLQRIIESNGGRIP